MEARGRAVALGVVAGVGDAIVRAFVGAPAPLPTPTGVERAFGVTLLATLLSFAATLAVPLVGAMRTRPSPSSPVRLAALLGAVAGVTAATTHLLVTASYVGAPFPEAVRLRLVGPLLVDAAAVAAYSGIAALAGFLLASREG